MITKINQNQTSFNLISPAEKLTTMQLIALAVAAVAVGILGLGTVAIFGAPAVGFALFCCLASFTSLGILGLFAGIKQSMRVEEKKKDESISISEPLPNAPLTPNLPLRSWRTESIPYPPWRRERSL